MKPSASVSVPLTGVERPIRCEFVVYGLAQPQGNKTPVVVGRVLENKPGRRVLLNPKAVLLEGRRDESRKAFVGWRTAVASEARAWVARNPTHRPWDGPLSIAIIFSLERPKSRRREHYHTTRPDLDKLIRAVFDSMRGTIWTDDARVAVQHATKTYADAAPFASIRIEPLELSERSAD